MALEATQPEKREGRGEERGFPQSVPCLLKLERTSTCYVHGSLESTFPLPERRLLSYVLRTLFLHWFPNWKCWLVNRKNGKLLKGNHSPFSAECWLY